MEGTALHGEMKEAGPFISSLHPNLRKSSFIAKQIASPLANTIPDSTRKRRVKTLEITRIERPGPGSMKGSDKLVPWPAPNYTGTEGIRMGRPFP